MIRTTSRLISLGSAGLIGAGGYFLRFLVEKRNQAQTSDLDQELVDKITKSNEKLTEQVEELKTTLAKLMDEMKEFVLRSQAGTVKKIAITSSLVITAGVVVAITFVPSIQRRLHGWVTSEAPAKPREPKNVISVNQNHASDPIPTPAETKAVIFLISRSSDPLREDILSLRNSVAQELQGSSIVIHVVDDLDDFYPVALVFRFELVDDRIRELDKKEGTSQDLFSRTNENCVWIFNCFKPNESVAGTAISNSLNDLANFKSGYTKKNGAKVSTWLRYEYVVQATPDNAGNLAHRLSDKEKTREKIVQIINDCI